MPAMDEPGRIVVFVPNWVGDAIMFTPTLRALRKRFPKAHIALFGRLAPIAVLTPNPWSNESLVETTGLFEAVRDLRRTRFDLAVLGPNSFRSAMTAWMAGAARRIGYDRDGRGWLLTDRIAPLRENGQFTVTPAMEYYLKLAERAGADVAQRQMELAVGVDDDARAEGLFVESGIDHTRPAVLLNPGASYGGAKMYPPDRFAAVALELAKQRGARIVINAGPGEAPIAAAVELAMGREADLNLAKVKNSLGLLKAVVSRCQLVITNDTGPRHIAAALGVSVVTIFGSTDPAWTTIDFARERIVRADDVPCSPCQKKTCPRPEGPDHHQCMLRIAPAQVAAAAMELLDGGGK